MEDDDEFAAAFNEDEPGQTADVGLSAEDEAAAHEAGEGEAEGGQEGAEPEGDAGQAGGGQATDAGAAVVLNETQPAADEDPAKAEQRLRSWEGRLKAREAELEKRAAELAKPAAEEEGPASENLESVAEAASAGGSEELAQAAQAAAEAIEDGDLSVEDAMRQLREDFGDDFVKIIETVVKATAKKAVAAPAKEKAAEAVEGDDAGHQAALRAHFEAIAAKHPDYQSVGASEEFKSYIASLPADKRADAEQVAKGGTAEEVNALLDAFKGAKTAATDEPSQEDTRTGEAMEELEGVRSAGVRLPEKPVPTGYEDAWASF